MHFFDIGRDFYAHGFLAQKLAWEIGIAALFLVMAFIGSHLLRRAFGMPTRSSDGDAPPPSVRTFQRYELGARLYHWGNFAVMALLLWSGAAFFFPGVVFPLTPYVGFSWLTVHVVLAGVFIVFLILHIIFAIVRTGVSQMWFHGGDGHDLWKRVGYYLGGGEPLPKSGKFDVFQKIYHALLTIFALVMIATGVSLFLSSEIIASPSHEWLRWQRILHDIFAFLFAVVILAHIYLRLIRRRWHTAVAMVTGAISREDFAREHDWARWQPSVEESRAQSVGAAVTPPTTGNEKDGRGHV